MKHRRKNGGVNELVIYFYIYIFAVNSLKRQLSRFGGKLWILSAATLRNIMNTRYPNNPTETLRDLSDQ